jgi:hypothetical protein
MARALGVANAALLAAGVTLVAAAAFYLLRRARARREGPPENHPGDPDA